ncbi:MAG: hypothetical protein KAG96_04075 [Ichthyobacteriaceae bacterium]|nr:hypothetical protein [Ichthyobacteriaceae bacterium]
MFRLSCGLYDQLEVFAMRKTEIKLSYFKGDDQVTATGVITDIKSKDGVEFVILNNSTEIKTQDIVTANDINFK